LGESSAFGYLVWINSIYLEIIRGLSVYSLIGFRMDLQQKKEAGFFVERLV
jgi:hypothetical protein